MTYYQSVRCARPARPTYGGQAVIEGVMMRGPQGFSVAVRRPSGEIVTRYFERPQLAARYPVLRWPLVRGLATLVEALTIGIESLLLSANEAVAGEGGGQKIGRAEGALAVVVGVAAAVGLFVLLPTVIVGPLTRLGASSTLVNLAEGALRLLILVGYIWTIGWMPDIRRVYQYHGAEHKVINAYEAGADYGSPAAAAAFGSSHPRCGTAFLLFVALVSVLLFAFFGWPNLWVRLGTRLALLPVIAGLAYECLRLGARTRSPLVRWLVAPGLWLQRLTTGRPDAGQLEVAARALAALDPPSVTEGDTPAVTEGGLRG